MRKSGGLSQENLSAMKLVSCLKVLGPLPRKMTHLQDGAFFLMFMLAVNHKLEIICNSKRSKLCQ